MPPQRANVRTAGAGGKNVVNLVELLLEALSKSGKQVPKLKPPPRGVPTEEQVRTLQELGRKPGRRITPQAQSLDEALQRLGTPGQGKAAGDEGVIRGLGEVRTQAATDQLDQLKKEFAFSIMSTGRPTTGTVDRLIDSLIRNRQTGGRSREQLQKQFLDEFGKKK